MIIHYPEAEYKEITLLSKEEIENKLKFIEPLVIRDGALWAIETPDYFDMSYTWSPVTKKKIKNLVIVGNQPTYHSCGYIGLFKPSIAEVISQIDDEMLGFADYFAIDGETVECCSTGTQHRARLLFYMNKSKHPEYKKLNFGHSAEEYHFGKSS